MQRHETMLGVSDRSLSAAGGPRNARKRAALPSVSCSKTWSQGLSGRRRGHSAHSHPVLHRAGRSKWSAPGPQKQPRRIGAVKPGIERAEATRIGYAAAHFRQKRSSSLSHQSGIRWERAGDPPTSNRATACSPRTNEGRFGSALITPSESLPKRMVCHTRPSAAPSSASSNSRHWSLRFVKSSINQSAPTNVRHYANVAVSWQGASRRPNAVLSAPTCPVPPPRCSKATTKYGSGTAANRAISVSITPSLSSRTKLDFQ